MLSIEDHHEKFNTFYVHCAPTSKWCFLIHERFYTYQILCSTIKIKHAYLLMLLHIFNWIILFISKQCEFTYKPKLAFLSFLQSVLAWSRSLDMGCLLSKFHKWTPAHDESENPAAADTSHHPKKVWIW